MLGFGVLFNLGGFVVNMNSLVVNGYDPVTLFFGLASLLVTLFAFGIMFMETFLWMEERRG
jgi:hypothetical protein